MPPNVKEDEVFKEPDHLEKLVAPQAAAWDYKLDPKGVAFFLILHLFGIYGITFVTSAKWSTLIFVWVYFVCGVLGMTAGSHRLWSHNSFRARLPLETFLVLCHSTLMQRSVIWWVQIHRQHHKYSDTDGDPMNAARSWFFSHVGWLMTNQHPDTIKRKKYVDATDVRNNPLLKFQKKYSFLILSAMAIIVPSLVPLLWGESFATAWYLNMLRLVLSFNLLFIINSVGHTWGNRPYDKSIRSTQSGFIGTVAFGDGYHNYHHVYPWDYRSSEWGTKWNATTAFIDFCAKIGLAYDLKSVPTDIAVDRAKRTGDGSRID